MEINLITILIHLAMVVKWSERLPVGDEVVDDTVDVRPLASVVLGEVVECV